VKKLEERAGMDNLSEKSEPGRIDGQSYESDYSIEHPLKGKPSQSPENARALDLYIESVRYLQDGDEYKAASLYQEALKEDPTLHTHACEALVELSKCCRPEDEGAIYYWLGIHNQYLEDYPQAGIWYAQAIDAFHKMGYEKREGRAHCNLGRIKVKQEDPSAIDEYKKAIALNPLDGFAHIDIGILYYMIDERERALDAFSEAVWADPTRYGPAVKRRLSYFTYKAEEDIEGIGKRLAVKQGFDLDKHTASERSDYMQAYEYFQIGNGFFQSGRCQGALEQFEKGKLVTDKFPGNYLGVSMVTMQMIEKGVIPGDQIQFYLEKADQNIEQCLRIAPTNPEYQRAKTIIGEYKKKYHVL
jgi:tetratricopeptide (TPR) repeat protein